jgi:hypothetical protein
MWSGFAIQKKGHSIQGVTSTESTPEKYDTLMPKREKFQEPSKNI